MSDKKFRKKLKENLSEILQELMREGRVYLYFPKNLAEDKKIHMRKND